MGIAYGGAMVENLWRTIRERVLRGEGGFNGGWKSMGCLLKEWELNSGGLTAWEQRTAAL